MHWMDIPLYPLKYPIFVSWCFSAVLFWIHWDMDVSHRHMFWSEKATLMLDISFLACGVFLPQCALLFSFLCACRKKGKCPQATYRHKGKKHGEIARGKCGDQWRFWTNFVMQFGEQVWQQFADEQIIDGKIVCIVGILCPASMDRSAAIAFNWWKSMEKSSRKHGNHMKKTKLFPAVVTLVNDFEPCNQRPDGSLHWKC